MDAVPTPTPPQPPTSPGGFLAAWPRSAQLTTAFLLGVCATLLAVHFGSTLRWGSRPSDLDRGALHAYRVDLNRASRAELLQLPGVGPNLAERIESRRPFDSIDQVTEVPGIGPATLERLRPFVRVQEYESSIDAPPSRPISKGAILHQSEESAPGPADRHQPGDRDRIATVA